MRGEDYALAGACAVGIPGSLAVMEKISPSQVGRGAFGPAFRVAWGIGLGLGFFAAYTQSTRKCYESCNVGDFLYISRFI